MLNSPQTPEITIHEYTNLIAEAVSFGERMRGEDYATGTSVHVHLQSVP